MEAINNRLIGILFILILNSCGKTDVNPVPGDPSKKYSLNLSGRVQNCDGNGLKDGVLVMESMWSILVLDISDGVFDTTIQSDYPFDSVYVWAIDYDALNTSDTLEIGVSGDSIQLGVISACHKEVDEYVSCQIDNDTFRFVPILWDTLRVSAWDTLSAPTTYIYRSDLYSNGGFHRMQFAGMAKGSFQLNWNSTFMIGRYYSFNMPATGSVTYTDYGNPGDYIRGTMNLPFVDNTDSLFHLLKGTFKVRRDF
jgi:hypothetical protein